MQLFSRSKRVPYLSSILLFLIVAVPLQLRAQVVGTVTSTFESMQQNGVGSMATFGDTLWIGPGLNRNIGNSDNWLKPQGADSVTDGRGRVFSLALARDTVMAGLGYDGVFKGEQTHVAMGFYQSLDGGETWNFIPMPKDEPDDTLVTYGGQQLKYRPAEVLGATPPYELDFKGDMVFTARWYAGLRRSTDFGKSWERIVLPPTYKSELNPEDDNDFVITPNNNPDVLQNATDRLNYLVFSTLIDHNGNVWAGTAGGVNISSDAMTASADSIHWRHVKYENDPQGLMSDWVITIKQQPGTNNVWMTNWVTDPNNGSQYGVVMSSDGGHTFKQFLEGTKANDIGFHNGSVFVAADDGLFISHDTGESWIRLNRIESDNAFIKSDAQFFSAASTTGRIWVGSSDGLASSTDEGRSWNITRVNMPLQGGNQYQEDAPDVKTYAYPNPFSPAEHQYVRIKFEVKEAGEVTIRLYDFGMNLIRVLENNSFQPGTYEAVWDGTDAKGRQVANGTVFYQVQTPGQTANGKILLLD